jgi:hypothetical protein
MQELMKHEDLGFKNEASTGISNSSMTEIAESRAAAEVQAQYVIAQRFPRNELARYTTIMEACKRPFLAEQAMYAYPRGGSLVTGPSIRLAEAMAQAWQHIEFGIKEISQSNGVSVAEAYAVDLQNNLRSSKIFHVKHERHTKKGIQKLTDPRDVYELVANQGARRMRACILAVLPGDVVEAAVERCKKTLESSDVPMSEQIRKMVIAFDEMGVKVEHLEKRLGHNLDATIPAEIVTLKGIYKSLKDGMADRSDYFDIAGTRNSEAKDELNNLIEAKKNKGQVNKTTGEVKD